MKRKFSIVVSFVEILSAGIWLGTLVSLGVAVAGNIFRTAKDINLAGQINYKVINSVNNIELICCIMLFVVAISNYFDFRSKFFYMKTVLVIMMFCLGTYYAFFLMNEMEYYRTFVIIDFYNATPFVEEAKEYYRTLHGRYTTTVGMNVFLLVIYIFIYSMEHYFKHDMKANVIA